MLEARDFVAIGLPVAIGPCHDVRICENEREDLRIFGSFECTRQRLPRDEEGEHEARND